MIYVTSGMTDSGDTIHPIIWYGKPPYDEVLRVLKERYPDEFYDNMCCIQFETLKPIEVPGWINDE